LVENASNDANSSDREVQRTLMELLNQLDGFSELDDVKINPMATNSAGTFWIRRF